MTDTRSGSDWLAQAIASAGVRDVFFTDPSDIAVALRRALAMNAAVLVDVVTDIDQRAPEPWLPEGM